MTGADPHFVPTSSAAAPPRASKVRLFSPTTIAAHTLFLTPLLGSILAAINHRRLGNSAALRRTLVFYALPSAILLMAEVVSSRRFSGALHLAGFAWTLSLARLLYLEQQVLFDEHLAAGGQRAAWYVPTIAAVGAIVLTLVAIFTLDLYSSSL